MTSSDDRRLRPIAPGPVAGRMPYLLAGGLSVAAAIALFLVAVGTSATPAVDPEPQALPEIQQTATEAESEDTAAADEAAVELPKVSYELFLVRDPFEPVVPEPEPEPDDPAETPDAADPDDPDAPVDPDDRPVDTNGVSNGPCTGDVEVVCNGQVLSVVEIFEDNGELVAVLQVDAMRYEVRVGDTFADVFEVVSISAEEVRILFGDRVVRITVGDNALK